MLFIYHKVYPLKVYILVVISIFIELCSHHHRLMLRYFLSHPPQHTQRNLGSITDHFASSIAQLQTIINLYLQSRFHHINGFLCCDLFYPFTLAFLLQLLKQQLTMYSLLELVLQTDYLGLKLNPSVYVLLNTGIKQWFSTFLILRSLIQFLMLW